jgi:hypothetical protein
MTLGSKGTRRPALTRENAGGKAPVSSDGFRRFGRSKMPDLHQVSKLWANSGRPQGAPGGPGASQTPKMTDFQPLKHFKIL